MANEILLKTGTPKVWKASGGDAVLTFASLAASGGSRQGVKLDLGATRANRYLVRLTVDFTSAPTAKGAVHVYFGFSPSATAGNENPGGLTGADAAGPDADLVDQLVSGYPGAMLADNSTNDQICDIGIVTAFHRYACPLIINDASQALNATEGNQKLELFPLIDEVQ